jgi:hypothetical protein
MGHTSNSGYDDAHHAIDVGLWVLAGIMAVIVFGDALILFAVVLAFVAAGGWIYRAVERRAETMGRYEAEMAPAPVTHLRPAWTRQRDFGTTVAPTPWRGPSAA